MISAQIISHPMNFKFSAGTSRGALLSKPTWFLVLKDSSTQNWGVGECSIIPKLSPEDNMDLDQKIKEVCNRINNQDIPSLDELQEWPALRFALETALLDLKHQQEIHPISSNFGNGNANIPINGLIWMGDVDFMETQIQQKIDQGFHCIKMKIGALDFQSELEILEGIRSKFSPEQIELRLDANGAFLPEEAQSKLDKLSKFHIHSIEQPIKPDQWRDMAVLCANSPIPIALDEELIGITDKALQIQMLNFIQPQYIILKPSLLGGLLSADQWIDIANQADIQWWATSALESNIGLNTIAQWASNKNTQMPQGLGTGQLFENNISSPLEIKNGELCYNQTDTWDTQLFTDAIN